MKNMNCSFGKLACAGVLTLGLAGHALAAATGGYDGGTASPSLSASLDRKTVDDAAITARVKAMLLQDESVKGLDVNVETHKGTVRLGGWVNNPMQIALAERIARGVEGVTGVKNDLLNEH